MTDPIADMLTRIRNAVTAKHTRVDLPASKLKAEIARILQDEGYIQGFRLVEEPAEQDRPPAAPGDPPVPEVRPARREASSAGIERISRPGRRVYLGVEDVPPVLGGLGTSILTTSRGVMTGRAAQEGGRRRRSALQRVVSRGSKPCPELVRSRSRSRRA